MDLCDFILLLIHKQLQAQLEEFLGVPHVALYLLICKMKSRTEFVYIALLRQIS